MGYRLFVSDGDLVAYGTTLFGYVDDKTFKQFKSYKVLEKIFPKWVTLELNHKEKTFSIYKLSAEQFREFFLAYAEDYMIHNSMQEFDACYYMGDAIADLFENDKEKEVSWK